mmetsp:Transcript_17737/g.26864  ORF Transcript_17737/g.26864 Transcript_17737/m.26864 type:complete len:204 (+) Transcript_17737:3728-4339(+)
MLMLRPTILRNWRNLSTVQMLLISSLLETDASTRDCIMLQKQSSQVSTITPSSLSVIFIWRNTVMLCPLQERLTTYRHGRLSAFLVSAPTNSALPRLAVLKSSNTQTIWMRLSTTIQTLVTSHILYLYLSKVLALKMRTSVSSPSWESCTQSMSPRRLWNTARSSFQNSTCRRLSELVNVLVSSHLPCTSTCRINNSIMLSRS